MFDIIDRVIDSGEPYRASAIPAVFDSDGDGIPETHYFNLVYQPLLDGNNEVYAIALVATEVSELVRAREIAESSQRAAEAANLAKSEFLAAMSHELRTPLNAISGYVELLEMGIHGPVTAAQLEALRRVRASQRHLLTLINDILSHARIQAGRTEFRIQPLLAAEIVGSIEALVSPQARARGIDYGADPCDGELQLLADEERVRQILLNLVGNAIKYTDPGGIVRISCRAEGEWVLFQVRDNGRGIPATNLESIFDPFTQVGRTLSRPEEGVGLGLAISRELARGMNGDISAESEMGVGSVFTLRMRRTGITGT